MTQTVLTAPLTSVVMLLLKTLVNNQDVLDIAGCSTFARDGGLEKPTWRPWVFPTYVGICDTVLYDFADWKGSTQIHLKLILKPVVVEGINMPVLRQYRKDHWIHTAYRLETVIPSMGYEKKAQTFDANPCMTFQQVLGLSADIRARWQAIYMRNPVDEMLLRYVGLDAVGMPQREWSLV
jgi:hypothetical protein